MSCSIAEALMPLRPALLAALAMDPVVGLNATQEAGTATEMPAAAPPIRVYPAGTGAAELVSAGLTVGLPDAAADADRVAETEAFTVPGALLHAVTATPIPITTGTAKNATLMCTIAAFPGN
jgi:hypothetical protein